MNRLKNKLRSRSGASLIIALAFLLFCTFVGGVVFVAATGNAQRIGHLAEQQTFLSERSAAKLVADMLRLEKGDRLGLYVYNIDRDYTEVEIQFGGVVKDVANPKTATHKVLLLQVDKTFDDLNDVQELMLGAAARWYIKDAIASIPDNAQIDKIIVEMYGLSNETGTNEPLVINKDNLQADLDKYFPPEKGGIKVVSPIDPVDDKGESIGLSGTFSLYQEEPENAGSSSEDEPEPPRQCDFQIDFGSQTLTEGSTGTGEKGKLSIVLDGMSVTRDMTETNYVTEDVGNVLQLEAANRAARIENSGVQTIIRWDAVSIAKGGGQ